MLDLAEPGPPPEILEEVAAAWERAQEPLDPDIELHFASLGGRAWGELRLVDGSLVDLLNATDALALACGDAVVRSAGDPVAV
jgi:hypothetical protein